MNPDDGPVISQARIDANWQAISFALDVPAKGRLERLLLRLRLPEPTVRVLAATPTLRRAWFIAMGLALVFALSVAGDASTESNLLIFAIVAPLVPTIGVAMAYGPGADPAHEVTVTTPMDGFTLVLLRAVAVFLVSIPIVGIVGLLIPDRSWLAAAWLLPAMALTAVALVGTTYVSPRRAGISVAVVWTIAMIVANRNLSNVVDAFGLGGQLVAIGALAVAGAVLYLRHDRFDEMGLTP